MLCFKLMCMSPFLPPFCMTICTDVNILLVVELLINKIFSMLSIYKSIIVNSQIGFDIALINVEATLKQHWYNVVSPLWNVALMLLQGQALNLNQHCATLKIRRRILFYFQRQINVITTLISTLFQRWSNVDSTLNCWLGGYPIYSRKCQLQTLHQDIYHQSFCCS